jgi:small GTP-binding protein
MRFYFFQLSLQGEEIIKRATIVLVGSGAVGKTTLINYLRNKSYSPDLTITDGIDMSHIAIDDVEFSVMDFAGQKDYAHTHSIFFRTDAIYLALFMPRSSSSYVEFENFLQMINDSAPTAPIILVTTRADEATLSEEEEAAMRSRYHRIIAVIPVDSKSGRGIEQLEQLLVKTALELPGTTRKVPKLFFSLERLLAQFAAQNRFSLSGEEFLKIAVDQIKLSVDSANIARDLFDMWGSVKVLKNGDVVLRPQQLADVFARIISMKAETLDRMGAARNGLLKYDEESLSVIWGDYDRHLWICEKNTVSSFITLLHDSGLAYPLYVW